MTKNEDINEAVSSLIKNGYYYLNTNHIGQREIEAVLDGNGIRYNPIVLGGVWIKIEKI